MSPPVPLRSPRHPLHLTLGLGAWAVWFTVVYSGLSVGCAVALPALASGSSTWLNAVLLAVTVLTIAGLVLAAWAAWRTARRIDADDDAAGRDRFTAGGAAALYLAAAICTAFVGVPLLWLPPCL